MNSADDTKDINAEWLAAGRSSIGVGAAIDRLFEAIDAAEAAWALVKLPEAREEERDLRVLANNIRSAKNGH